MTAQSELEAWQLQMIRLIPTKHPAQVPAGRLRNGLALSRHGEGIERLIAIGIGKRIDHLIEFLAVEVVDAPCVVGLEERQLTAWLHERFHIPHILMAPMLVVAPGIDLTVHLCGNAVDIAFENDFPVDGQARMADAVMMEGVFHIVVGPDAEAHLSPRRELSLQIMGGEIEILLAVAAVEDALPFLRVGHEGVGLRRCLINEILSQIRQRVTHRPRTRIVDFEMEMGSHAAARIAADGHQLPAADGHLMGTQIDIGGVLRRFMPFRNIIRLPVLPTITGDTGTLHGRKILQVAIHRTVAIGMLNENGIAKAKESHGDTRHIAVGNGEEGLAHSHSRTDVDTSMKMMRTRFTKVARQRDVVIVDGRNKL